MSRAHSSVPNPEPRTPNPGFRSGFVAVVGGANAGKSSLVNRLVARKITIVTPVRQTTVAPIRGVLHLPTAQIVFVDTPAIHRPRHRLGRRMVEETRRALSDSDAVVWLVDAAKGLTDEDQEMAAHLRPIAARVVVAINKMDRASPAHLTTLEDEIRGLGPFAAVVPVSATGGTNLSHLMEILVDLLPEGPPYFPPETATDQPEQFLVRELIREQVILLTRQELPHTVGVVIEELAPRENSDLVYIRATLHLEREAHKKMLIGKEGRRLKEIGRRARGEIEALLGTRVYLDLWVKTTKGWRDRDDFIRALYPE